MVKQDRAALITLRTQLIKARDNHRRIDTAFDHVRIQVVVAFQKPSDMQAPTRACGRYLDGGTSRLPRVRERGRVIPLRDLRNEHVDWLTNTLSKRAGLKGPRISNTRLNDILLKVVRPLLDLAYEREYLTKNPHRWIQKRREERPDDIDPFSIEEMLTFLATLPAPHWVRFYTVAFGTGLRPSEQYALTWEHVDFKGKVLLIRQGFVQNRLTILKTKGSWRDVDMLLHVEEALQQHQEATGREGQFVFTNGTGGPLHRDNMRNRIWNPTLKQAGLRHRSPYQTRHTFASLMLLANEDMAWIARMMGHTSLRMLQERYAKFIRRCPRQDGQAFMNVLYTAKETQPSLDRPSGFYRRRVCCLST
jgi:integrase